MKAQHIRPTEMCAPHWYGYEVYFGLDDGHRGVLTRLDNQLAVRRWLLQNPQPSLIDVEGWRVTFAMEDDARRFFEAFS